MIRSFVWTQAWYAADISLSGELCGRMRGSPFAHARIKSIDPDKARTVPGVHAVVTEKDFPYLHGECIINIPLLAIDRVRYVGEPGARWTIPSHPPRVEGCLRR